jgi:hypothetical protein
MMAIAACRSTGVGKYRATRVYWIPLLPHNAVKAALWYRRLSNGWRPGALLPDGALPEKNGGL